jgi:ribonuclease III
MLATLQHRLGYHFNAIALLELALTHRSQHYLDANDVPLNNQRLEFLGDAVLGAIIADMLYQAYPHDAEGDLSKRQVALVNGEHLVMLAKTLAIGEALDVSPGEAEHGGRQTPSNLEDALEAIVGAIYLDGGMDAARQFVQRHWAEHVNTMHSVPKDAKTTLQEWAQARSLALPEYVVVEASGPAHAPEFVLEVRVKGHGAAQATARTKKLAEREAASVMLSRLGVA